MGRPPKKEGTPRRAQRRPAKTPEERESQLVSMAMDLAESRIREGTASAQELTHFLKLGTTRNQLEQEKLMRENKLLEAKAEQIESGQRTEELYSEALSALRSYKGDQSVE